MCAGHPVEYKRAQSPMARNQGVKLTVQGAQNTWRIITRLDPRGNAYYWIAGTLVDRMKPGRDYARSNTATSRDALHFDVPTRLLQDRPGRKLEARLNRRKAEGHARLRNRAHCGPGAPGRGVCALCRGVGLTRRIRDEIVVTCEVRSICRHKVRILRQQNCLER